MNLHEQLAKLAANPEKRRTNYDNDFFAPYQRGKFLITKIVNHSKGLKTTVILEGKILEATSTREGVVPQAPGTNVKKVYALSKFEFHMDMLMNDLLNIGGFTGKEDNTSAYIKTALDDNALCGVVAAFKTDLSTTNKKTGQVRTTPITEVHFSALEKENEEAQVEARKKEILG